MKFDGKNILVTGAGRDRGIGAAIIRELLKHKTGKIYAAARKPESMPDFKDPRVVKIALDITDPKSISAAAGQAKDIHVLINNAGIASVASIADGDSKLLDADMETNYFGTIHMMRAFAPVIQKNGQGLIANVCSVVSFAPFTAIGGYSASKAALHSATQAARAEFAPRGIKIAGIYPGPIDTDMARDFEMDKTSPEETARNIVAGLIAGEDYIFPDPMSQGAGAQWRKDPLGLEKQFLQPEEKAA